MPCEQPTASYKRGASLDEPKARGSGTLQRVDSKSLLCRLQDSAVLVRARTSLGTTILDPRFVLLGQLYRADNVFRELCAAAEEATVHVPFSLPESRSHSCFHGLAATQGAKSTATAFVVAATPGSVAVGGDQSRAMLGRRSTAAGGGATAVLAAAKADAPPSGGGLAGRFGARLADALRSAFH